MKKTKSLGVELCRGVATYAVVLVHSGDETWGLPIASSAIAFRLFFYFAVPFFLATAFYFMTAKSEISYSAKFWKSRIERLLIPYVVWSIIFLISRVVVFTLSNRPERLQQLLQDPLSIVFLGGASYHLYFLPLLLAGTLLVLWMPLLDKLRINQYVLIFLSITSIFLYHLLEISGNAFQLGAGIAFQGLFEFWKLSPDHYPGLRLAFVEFAWIIRCLPYFFIALTLNRLPQNPKFLHQSTSSIGWAMAFILSSTLGQQFLPGALQEVLLGYTLLLLGLSLSNYFSESKVARAVTSVGVCSFGIYLLHPFVMNVVKPIIGRFLPGATASVSIFSMLLLSIPCFFMSWLVVFCLCRYRVIAKYQFGV